MAVRAQADADAFLDRAGWTTAARTALAGDASARHYDRLTRGADRAILMQAGAAAGAETACFARLARWLRGAGFSAPAVLADDADRGLLLLEDLGDALFARVVAADPAQEAPLYTAAIDMLAALQAAPPPPGLPVWDAATLGAMVAPFADHYAPFCDQDPARLAALPAVVADLAATLLDPAHVVCLRDCHAENLIWLPDRSGVARVGLLDFQDAFLGPAAYDLVSLLHDARRDLAPGLAARLTARFVAATGADADRFGAAAALLSAQRNLRILGIFARLATVDGKPGYLRFVPRVRGHVAAALAHPALAPLARAVGPLPSPRGVGDG